MRKFYLNDSFEREAEINAAFSGLSAAMPC